MKRPSAKARKTPKLRVLPGGRNWRGEPARKCYVCSSTRIVPGFDPETRVCERCGAVQELEPEREREVSCEDGFCPKPAWLVAFETEERCGAFVGAHTLGSVWCQRPRGHEGACSGSMNLEGFQRLAVASDLGLDFEIPGLVEKMRSGR